MEEQINAAQKLANTLIEFFVNYSFQVMGAIIILVVGFLLAKWTSRLVYGVCSQRKMDAMLSKFLASASQSLVLIFAIIIALGKFGITIAPFVAAIGAAAFGATYAIQGPLSNYGAGLSIILGRPFTLGDTITVVGMSGVVRDVQLGVTILENEDGTRITIPNKHIVGEIVQNSKASRVAEGVVGVSYDSDVTAAIAAISSAIQRFDEVLKTPPPQIGLQQFADSSLNIAYRYWVSTLKYFSLTSAVNLAILKALKDANIEIPFPQSEVRIVSQQQV